MVDRALIDTLNYKAKDFAIRWKDKIRKNPQLKHFNAMPDEALTDDEQSFFPLLARTIDRGVDRSLVGDFFVRKGKSLRAEGVPVSEANYAISLVQQVVIEYLMNDYVMDSTIRMYQAMGTVTQVAEFFMLGNFYLVKGFLEATVVNMKKKDAISDELLKKYFTDDFFFKKDHPDDC
jgi:hypothetical protein